MNTATNPTEPTIHSYQCYSFAEVFEKIQPLLKDGLRFDLETNQGYPQIFATLFTFTVIEGGEQSVAPSDTLILPGGGHVPAVPVEDSQTVVTEIPVVKVPKTRRAKLEG